MCNMPIFKGARLRRVWKGNRYLRLRLRPDGARLLSTPASCVLAFPRHDAVKRRYLFHSLKIWNSIRNIDTFNTVAMLKLIYFDSLLHKGSWLILRGCQRLKCSGRRTCPSSRLFWTSSSSATMSSGTQAKSSDVHPQRRDWMMCIHTSSMTNLWVLLWVRVERLKGEQREPGLWAHGATKRLPGAVSKLWASRAQTPPPLRFSSGSISNSLREKASS